MKWTYFPALSSLALFGLSATSMAQAPEVALAPFVVLEGDAPLRAAADSVLTRLAAALTAQGIRIARHSRLDEKNLSRALPARWAVTGDFRWKEGVVRVELRLMEVATGDELRAFFNSDKDPRTLGPTGDAVASRVALFVKEQRAGGKEP